MMQRASGFSLIELSVTMAIAGITALAAIGLYAGLVRSVTNARKANDLTGHSHNAVDYVVKDLRTVGGNGIPSAAAIFVEDGVSMRGDPGIGFPGGEDSLVRCASPPCGASDRLTTFSAVKGAPGCAISALDNEAADHHKGRARFVMASPPTDCCYAAGPFQRTAMFIRDGKFRPVLLTGNNAAGSTTCEYAWQDIVAETMRTALATVTDPALVVSENFVGGRSVLVDFRTIYLDTETHQLIMHMDRLGANLTTLNDSGAHPSVSGERLLLMDNVFDFQVSLGYDLDADGLVEESLTAVGDDDEWLFNASLDLLPSNLAALTGIEDGSTTPWTVSIGSLATAQRDMLAIASFSKTATERFRVPLRMGRVETVVGVKTDGIGAGGSLRSRSRSEQPIHVDGYLLRQVGLRFALNNLDGGGIEAAPPRPTVALE